MEVRLAPGLEAALLAEAARAHPEECCGLLLGDEGAGGSIAAILPAANVAPDPKRHFEIDPAALIAAARHARQGGPAVLGYYHSHPSGNPAPSRSDRAMAAHDGRIWAIVAGGRLKFWRDGARSFEVLGFVLSSEGVDG